MRLELTGRHVEITPALRRLVEGKLAKLERLLNQRALSAHAVLTREKHRHRTDVTLHARGEKFLHGMGDTAAWPTSVAQAIEKITQQAQRVKSKWQARKGSHNGRGRRDEALAVGREAARGAQAAETSVPDSLAASRRFERARMPCVLRETRQPVRSMSVADAARQLAVAGDGVVLFLDVETAAVSVLYRRPDGELTLVQADT
jgi:putative sigma-54 modulation protein